MPKIGSSLAKKLNRVGIDNFVELEQMGCRDVFLKIRVKLNDGCLNLPYALEGVVQGILCHSLSKVDKNLLKEYYESIEVK